MMVIAARITIEWSWKNIKCSMRGELAFWKDTLFHTGII